MHRALLPPRPHFLGDEGQERREEAQLYVESDGEGGLGGRGALGALAAVRAILHELDVVIGERPEERLRELESPGVVVVLEGRRRLAHGLGEVREHRAIQWSGDSRGVQDRRAGQAGPVGLGGLERQHELRRVEDLDRQAPADLHLADIEGGVGAGATRCGPVADSIGSVLIEQAHRRDDVALGLAHLLAIGVEDPPADRRVAPGQAIELKVAAHHGREKPGADDLVCLRAQIHGEDARPQILIAAPATGDLRAQRRRRPGIHDIRVADEATGLAALIL